MSSDVKRRLPAGLPPRPSWSELPLRKDGPRGNAWGLFDDLDKERKDGNNQFESRSDLGLLNYLTPQVTAAALSEIDHGIRISTDLPLDYFKLPTFERIAVEHSIKPKGNYAINDDEVRFNPQASTQWDGFRHFAYQDTREYYNGRKFEEFEKTDKLGIQAWSERGGLAGRGVLLDYSSWAISTGVEVKPFEYFTISVSDLRNVAAAQGTEIRQNDILLIRTGYLAAWPSLTRAEHEEREKATPSLVPYLGLEQSEEMLRFLWDTGVVAVAADNPTVEAWPIPLHDNRFWLHEWLLAGWGCPLGEYFNLEQLAQECRAHNKWSFFFSSMPTKITGGCAAPANGVAIM